MSIIILSLIIVSIVFSVIDSRHHKKRYEIELLEREKLARKHFNYRTNLEWTWWDEYDRIQKHYLESEKRTILRKVNFENQSEIMMHLGDDYRLVVYVKFFTSCTPGTFIKTTKKYSDGTPQKLTCQEHQVNDVSHTYLINRFSIESYSGSTIIQGDLDGFKFDSGSLYDWKLDELKKEITLLRAEPKK